MKETHKNKSNWRFFLKKQSLFWKNSYLHEKVYELYNLPGVVFSGIKDLRLA